MAGPWLQRVLTLAGLVSVAGVLAKAAGEFEPLDLFSMPVYYLSEIAWTEATADALSNLVGLIREHTPFSAWWFLGGLIVLWGTLERVRFEDRGIRLYFGLPQLTLAFVRWERVRKLTLIEHSRSDPTLLVQYDTWLGLPWKLGVHSRRYHRGGELVQLIATQAATQGIPVRKIRVATIFLWAGWILIASGIGYIALTRWSMTVGAEAYFASDTAYLGYPPMPSPLSLACMFLGGVAWISAGFGFLSVYHRGSPRTGLFLLWMMFIVGQAPIAIYTLTWIAIISIWHATPTPHPYIEFHATIPVWSLILPLYADLLVLLVAPFAYYGACYWAFSGNRIRDVVGAKRRRVRAVSPAATAGTTSALHRS